MDDSEYKYFPMIMDNYSPGMRLEKGWWIRSAVGTVMLILYGNKNVEETGVPLKEGEVDLTVKGNKVLIAKVGSFSSSGEAEMLRSAISDSDIKELLDSDHGEGYWFRVSNTKKDNDLLSWTIFRPQTKEEKQNACNGTLNGIKEQEICDGCIKRRKGLCNN